MSEFGPSSFSALTGLSAKALRLYEERGLLMPATTDPLTGYRRYAEAQLALASRIALLRRAGVGLAEIARFLASPTSATIEDWLGSLHAETRERERALLALSEALGLGPPIPKETSLLVTVRTVASLSELADVFDLVGAQFDPSFDRTDEHRFGDLREAFPDGRDLLLLAESEAETIGGALGFTNDGKNTTLRALAVREESRGQGIGRSLLRSFEAAVRLCGAETINLGASDAVGFYVRHGYQTLLLLQWVYDASTYEAEADVLLDGPLAGMTHKRGSFRNIRNCSWSSTSPIPPYVTKSRTS